jgi:hypothetical protein
VFKQKPAIEDRRLGQFLTGDSVKNSPALTLGYFTLSKNAARMLCLCWFDIHPVLSLNNSRLGYLILRL